MRNFIGLQDCVKRTDLTNHLSVHRRWLKPDEDNAWVLIRKGLWCLVPRSMNAADGAAWYFQIGITDLGVSSRCQHASIRSRPRSC